MRSDASLILEEPAPCDSCASAQVCRFTGSACKAFSKYINGEAWEGVARTPTLRQGKSLGLKAVELTDTEREWSLSVMTE